MVEGTLPLDRAEHAWFKQAVIAANHPADIMPR